jgi:lipopolysaccharide assembly outer membrane protein LptD (OstA)
MKASWVMVSAQVVNPDSLILGTNLTDSLGINANSVDSIIPEDNFGIEFPVFTDAADSTIMDVDNEIVYLYRDAVIKYGDLELRAAYIEFNFKTFVVKAKGVPDSTGALIGKPVFKQGSNEFTEDSLLYNFKTKQGITYMARTQEGEAYLITEKSKIHSNKWVHIRNGMFTTCNNEKPHYHFRLSKAIAIPNDKVVSGPLYMKVGKVPYTTSSSLWIFP